MSTVPPPPRLPAIDIVTLHAPDAGRVFARQACSLAAAGARVRLLAPGAPGDRRRGVERVGVSRPRGRIERLALTPWRLFAAACERPASVVYLHDASLLFLLPLLTMMGRRCVYDAHEDYGNMVRHREWIPRPLRGIAGWGADRFERGLSRRAVGVVTATGPLRDKFPRHRTITVYNLPTEHHLARGAREQTPAREREFDLVHLGTLNPRRRSFFASVLEGLFDRRPEARVLIVGAPDSHARWWLRRFPRRRVQTVGWVPHDRVPGLLGRCRVGVSVHPWLTPHLALAVPVKVFEYMACGCAVVCSRMPELERLLRPADLARIEVVDGDDRSAWLRAIEGWLADPDRIDREAARLRDGLAERYSWRREEERLLAFFREVTGEGEGR